MAKGQMLSLFFFFVEITFGFPASEVSVDVDKLPGTSFSCQGKVIGGYYADIESGCQMFHVCTLGVKGEIRDIKFLCLSGTIFDQETRVCERLDEVNCSQSAKFYDLNLDLFGSHGVILGRSAREGDGIIIDEEAQATSNTSEDHYVDYDYSEDSAISAQASNEKFVVVKFEADRDREAKSASAGTLNLDLALIVNITGVTVTSGEPLLPPIRKKRSLDTAGKMILPPTQFSCTGRVVGGLYADIESGCQLFHICAQGKKNRVVDHKFFCGEGTLFDQVSRTCQEASKVNCDQSEGYYSLNDHFQLVETVDLEDEFDFPKIPKEASSTA